MASTQPGSAQSPFAAPGALRANKSGLFVYCGGATELRVVSVKREGSKPVNALEFLAGAQLTEGERFGET